MNRIRAVFFDLDGTLLDTKGQIEEIANETFREIGVAPVEEGYFVGLLKKGLGMRYHLAEVEKKPELYGRAKGVFVRNYAKHIGAIKPFEGVEKMLLDLKKMGLKIGICTSQHAQMLRLTLESFRLPADLAISRDDVANGKPAPDQINLLCKKLSVRPEKALMVGDWTGDISAGKSAGTMTAGVLTGICTMEELIEIEPDYILENAKGAMNVVQENNTLP